MKGHAKGNVIKHSLQKLCKPRTIAGFATSLALSLPLTNSSIGVEFDLIGHCSSPGGARAWLVARKSMGSKRPRASFRAKRSAAKVPASSWFTASKQSV